MKVTFDLDPRDVWRIQEEADRRGVTAGTVLRDEIARKRKTSQLRDQIRAMVLDRHMCDAEIAAELGYTNDWIAELRRGMGLPANKRYPKRVPDHQRNSAERKTA